MCAILALAEKRYRRSVEVLQHKLKSERQIRVIHQTCAGGQDGWNWPYFLGVYEQKHARKKKKKERSQYSAILTEQAWMMKDLSHSYQRNFSCETAGSRD